MISWLLFTALLLDKTILLFSDLLLIIIFGSESSKFDERWRMQAYSISKHVAGLFKLHQDSNQTSALICLLLEHYFIYGYVSLIIVAREISTIYYFLRFTITRDVIFVTRALYTRFTTRAWRYLKRRFFFWSFNNLEINKQYYCNIS